MPRVAPPVERDQVIETQRYHSYRVTAKTAELVTARTNGRTLSNPDMVGALLELIDDLLNNSKVKPPVVGNKQATDPAYISAAEVARALAEGKRDYGWCAIANRAVTAMGINWRNPAGYVQRQTVYEVAIRYAERNGQLERVEAILRGIGVRPSNSYAVAG